MKRHSVPRTASDLAFKLQRDFTRLHHDPANADAAFDFFLTADALMRWLHPAPAERDELYSREPLLEIASRLAEGSMHLSSKRYNLLTKIMKTRGVGARMTWPGGFWPTHRLVIVTQKETSPEAAGAPDALGTARSLCAFWEAYFAIPPHPMG